MNPLSWSVSFILFLIICVCYSLPVENKEINKDSKSAFGQAFDEIVVESSLTVRRKSTGRQARNQNVTTTTPINDTEAAFVILDKKKPKREVILQNWHHLTTSSNN